MPKKVRPAGEYRSFKSPYVKRLNLKEKSMRYVFFLRVSNEI
jgi:hypothetical protein